MQKAWNPQRSYLQEPHAQSLASAAKGIQVEGDMKYLSLMRSWRHVSNVSR